MSSPQKATEEGGDNLNNLESATISPENSHPSKEKINDTNTNSIANKPEQEDDKVIGFFKKKTAGVTKRQFIFICIFAFVEFFAGTVVSIQAPFFPEVASEKGASATEYGFVFGIFEIVVFLMSPLFGSKMHILGPMRLFNLGILTSGACCVIFGLLHHIDSRFVFISACLIVRAFEALGHAAFVTASFTIIAIEFPQTVATTFALMETFYGFGLMAGPTLGGALYEVGGFSVPFVSIGSLHILGALATYIFLPRKPTSLKPNEIPRASGFQMFKILRVPPIAIIAFSIVATSIGIGFLSANLEPFLRQFNLSKLAIGGIFIVDGGTYCLTAPIWGWICDHTERHKLITFIGCLFTIFAFILVGPAPFIPLNPKLWMIIIALVLSGLGQGAVLVAAFVQFLQDSIDKGYPDDISTYGLVSGLWTSMLALGNFIGPTVGGIFYDFFGFRWGSLFVVANQLILIALLGIYFCRKRISSTKYELGTVPIPTELHSISTSTTPTKITVTMPQFRDTSINNLSFIDD